jgi:hypothetical protein
MSSHSLTYDSQLLNVNLKQEKDAELAKIAPVA